MKKGRPMPAVEARCNYERNNTDAKTYYHFFSTRCFFAVAQAARAQSCKVCAEQRAACMKNYAGPACKTEYQMCLKSCKK